MDIKHGYGVLREPRPVRHFKFDLATGYQPREDLPDEYEIPAERLPDIHDQGSTSMCVAYALCEVAEAACNNVEHFSPAWNYGRAESRNGYTGEGLYMSQALAGAAKIGFVPEYFYPFKDDVPTALEQAAARDDLIKIGEQLKPTSYVAFEYAYKVKLWDCIRAALVEYNTPVVLFVPTYFGAGHAVIAYGYTAKYGDRRLKIQNSWGKGWRNGGRGEILISEVEDAYLLMWEPIKLPFTDVEANDWFYEDVKKAYLSGLVKGVTDTEFEPNANIKRGDVAVIIDKLLTAVEESVNAFAATVRQGGGNCSDIAFGSNVKAAFEDVSDNDYYCSAIGRVVANGIMNGRSGSKFEPSEPMTRAELAAVGARTVDMLSVALSAALRKSVSPETSDGLVPTDVGAAAWYAEYVKRAYKYGIMQGYEDGTFRPDNFMTRAEAAAILNRVFRQVDIMLKGLAVTE